MLFFLIGFEELLLCTVEEEPGTLVAPDLTAGGGWREFERLS